MTSEREPVDDAALIADVAEVLREAAQVFADLYHKPDSVIGRKIDALLAKLQPPAPEPKPDRAEVLAEELWDKDGGPSLKDWTAIIRRHFDELRAEWEAERPVIYVPEDVLKVAERVKADSYFRTAEFTVADFILQLAKGPSQ